LSAGDNGNTGKGNLMMDIIETIAVAFIFSGLILAMNENTSKMYINLIGAGLAVLGMLILRITGKDA
jgi:threonine/homoserine efflux transporter RhtA